MLDKNLITTQQAADEIGCTAAHVRLLLKRGKLRGEKVSGNLWLCDKRHVDQVAKRPSSVGRPRGDKKKP
jgi:excisionase family DNA binding protein